MHLATSEVETFKQNFGEVYQANVAYTVISSLDKVVKFYQQNGNLEKARLFTTLSSQLCELAKKSVPYIKAIGTAIDRNSTNFQQQFNQFNYDPMGTTAKSVQQLCHAVIESMDSNGRMILDKQYGEERAKLLNAQVQKFANLPGPQKLEKATEFTLGLFSQVALLGPTGLSTAEIAALSEASQTMYGALKTECIYAYQLAIKTGLPPQSFAGLSNVIREFPETLVTSLQFGTGEAKTLFKFAIEDKELISSTYLGNSISERIKNFAKRFKDKRSGQHSKILETGARRVAPLNECDAELIWAPKKYEEIRKSTTDIDIIVKNTGIPKYKIEKIKHHIFHDDTHILREGPGRFAPDSEIASTWDRLIAGDFVANDLKLLEHEYFESKFEKIFKTYYDTAHAKTINTKQKGGKDREWNPANNE